MLTLIDRQMLWGFIKSYLVVLTSLLTLYIIVDLFTNLDDFAGKNKPLSEVATDIGTFYGYQLTQIFDRLCEAIALLASMFAIAMMQRSNEQVPLLSAGISTWRIVTPVLLGAFVTLTLTVLNTELIIPNIADKLMSNKEDPHAKKEVPIRGSYEPNGIHIEGDKADRLTGLVYNLRVTIPESVAGNLVHLTAKHAIFHPDPSIGRGGRWELMQTNPPEIEGWDRKNPILEPLDTGRFLLHVREVSFAAITRNPNWFSFASTWRLYQEMQRADVARIPSLAVLFHVRLVRPVLGMVLVLLGVSVILRDQNRNIFISAGICLILCGLFFGLVYTCKIMGESDFLSPALAAWLPVIIFGPFSLVLFDAVHT
ncbi:MAG: LptF/LptG family permease [Planctomycetota bacterium]|nr:LptF/LptG family permease [Planctomycetota bacterium]